ncbi:acetyl-CoA carboxylase biotin carboxyl carrier protein [Hyphococcus luteus]|uniref:Biotin carboxyl carrier protein of acetyl-CoA carboxylase n=1 Tax=Hyphococcus luteus TaxID=2058213 RepID=A0A2S7JZL6_9PROT|nr:biotin/lipoyl-containing protein [Marinicaulis flavus]PQA85680.1 acetyl-CoA carboxylase biotin carboxyl carrier protein subunit [Marinicaulis flavus]
MVDDLPLTPEDVEEITSILSKSSYDVLDIETARFRLRVKRAGEGFTQEWTPIGGETKEVASAVEPEVAAEQDGLLVIKPPLPGTFYRAPQPGAPPFVEVGDKVTADTVVAIIETMKLMNPVHAGVEGEIVEIIPENAEPIEATTVLMKVKPA